MNLLEQAIYSFKYAFSSKEDRGEFFSGIPEFLIRPFFNFEVDAFLNAKLSQDFISNDDENA